MVAMYFIMFSDYERIERVVSYIRKKYQDIFILMIDYSHFYSVGASFDFLQDKVLHTCREEDLAFNYTLVENFKTLI
ncbi:MAG: hypothetical protein MJ198_05220 [Bacteroidales bacterium]|nr:hypothetical protein [Bacteroidales bacterium]